MEQKEEERGIWQERGSEGDKAARGGGMVSAHWVWSGQVASVHLRLQHHREEMV